MPWVTLRVTGLRRAAYSKRTQSVQNGIPTRSMGTIGALPNAYRSSRSSVGMPWVTLRVTGLRRAAYSKRTRSALNGIPTRSMGTIGALPNAYRSSRSSVGMPWATLRVTNLRRAAYSKADAERPERHTHAEHGHDRCSPECLSFLTLQRGNAVGDAPRHRSAPRRILKSGRGAP